MKYYILLTFFPIYYSLVKYCKQVCLKNLFFYKNDSLELSNRFVKEGYGDGYDSRISNVTDGLLTKVYENFEKMYLLKILENNDINIHTKLSLIFYYESLNNPYLTNLHAGGLLDDWDFI
jgi:hypothetical protein